MCSVRGEGRREVKVAGVPLVEEETELLLGDEGEHLLSSRLLWRTVTVRVLNAGIERFSLTCSRQHLKTAPDYRRLVNVGLTHKE